MSKKIRACPYCGRKVSYIEALSEVNSGEHTCPGCSANSNISYNKKIYIPTAIVLVAAVAAAILLFKLNIIKNLLLASAIVLIPFAFFFFMTPLYFNLEAIGNAAARMPVKPVRQNNKNRHSADVKNTTAGNGEQNTMGKNTHSFKDKFNKFVRTYVIVDDDDDENNSEPSVPEYDYNDPQEDYDNQSWRRMDDYGEEDENNEDNENYSVSYDDAEETFSQDEAEKNDEYDEEFDENLDEEEIREYQDISSSSYDDRSAYVSVSVPESIKNAEADKNPEEAEEQYDTADVSDEERKPVYHKMTKTTQVDHLYFPLDSDELYVDIFTPDPEPEPEISEDDRDDEDVMLFFDSAPTEEEELEFGKPVEAEEKITEDVYEDNFSSQEDIEEISEEQPEDLEKNNTQEEEIQTSVKNDLFAYDPERSVIHVDITDTLIPENKTGAEDTKKAENIPRSKAQIEEKKIEETNYPVSGVDDEEEITAESESENDEAESFEPAAVTESHDEEYVRDLSIAEVQIAKDLDEIMNFHEPVKADDDDPDDDEDIPAQNIENNENTEISEKVTADEDDEDEEESDLSAKIPDSEQSKSLKLDFEESAAAKQTSVKEIAPSFTLVDKEEEDSEIASSFVLESDTEPQESFVLNDKEDYIERNLFGADDEDENIETEESVEGAVEYIPEKEHAESTTAKEEAIEKVDEKANEKADEKADEEDNENIEDEDDSFVVDYSEDSSAEKSSEGKIDLSEFQTSTYVEDEPEEEKKEKPSAKAKPEIEKKVNVTKPSSAAVKKDRKPDVTAEAVKQQQKKKAEKKPLPETEEKQEPAEDKKISKYEKKFPNAAKAAAEEAAENERRRKAEQLERERRAREERARREALEAEEENKPKKSGGFFAKLKERIVAATESERQEVFEADERERKLAEKEAKRKEKEKAKSAASKTESRKSADTSEKRRQERAPQSDTRVRRPKQASESNTDGKTKVLEPIKGEETYEQSEKIVFDKVKSEMAKEKSESVTQQDKMRIISEKAEREKQLKSAERRRAEQERRAAQSQKDRQEQQRRAEGSEKAEQIRREQMKRARKSQQELNAEDEVRKSGNISLKETGSVRSSVSQKKKKRKKQAEDYFSE